MLCLTVEPPPSAPPLPSLPPPSSPAPRIPKDCYICGKRDHVKADCPRKQDWCVRCSLYGHRHSNCQDRDLECELCLSQGRSSLALGHHKYVLSPFPVILPPFFVRRVHAETDPDRRARILTVVPRDCFPDWRHGPSKRSRFA